MYVPQLSYPFICQWTSRLLPCPSYCKQCCNEHWGTSVFSILVSSVCMPSSGIVGLYTDFFTVQKLSHQATHIACSFKILYGHNFSRRLSLATLFNTMKYLSFASIYKKVLCDIVECMDSYHIIAFIIL